MQQQDKIIVWPIYFDQTKTRTQGRRVPKNLAVPLPKANELSEAAEKLRLNHEFIADVAHPKTSWAKTGVILVRKKRAKEDVIKSIAKQLVKTRNTASAATMKQG